jgi:FAD:protein FMN transferase
MKRTIPIVLVILLLVVFFAATRHEREYSFSGKTMGTTYHVEIVAGFFYRPSDLKKKIDNRLDDINKSMSTYISTSEISRFNQSSDTRSSFPASPDFLHVMMVGQGLHQLTGGAWDGSIKPLVDLWGFGSAPHEDRVPDTRKIEEALQDVGFDRIEVSKDGIRKKIPHMTVDLASIAKGYGVDAISEEIRKNGIDDFIVEIGGEVYASGVRKDKQFWRVGINTPSPEASFDMVYKVISLSGEAMATSGDYRNFFEKGGVRYSHIIDPKTGLPVKNGVVSVSVIADTCTFADGLATGLMVMGHKAGIALTDRLKNADCLIIVRNADGSLSEHYSKGFPR